MIDRERDGGVLRLTLNAPERLNALSDEMLAELKNTLADTDDAKAVILAGAGRAFCAGHDLRQMQAARQAVDGGAAAFADLFERCTEVMLSIRTLPVPVIAQVHGVAVAAGCQLAATCDMVVAAVDARFGVNGVNIGLFCSTPMVALTRAVGRKAAFEMLTTGRLVGAEEARRMGLVNRVVPAGALEEEATALAQEVAGKLGAAVRIGKRLFHEQAELDERTAYALAGQAMVTNLAEPDTAEGMQAFIEKRPPNWH